MLILSCYSKFEGIYRKFVNSSWPTLKLATPEFSMESQKLKLRVIVAPLPSVVQKLLHFENIFSSHSNGRPGPGTFVVEPKIT